MSVQKDLLEIMKEESESEHVAFTEFALCYSKTNNRVWYCFFEGGEDKKYYGHRIELKTGKEFRDFNCGGKDGVLKLLELISAKNEYKSANVLYFVDRDYTNQRITDNLYVTPCYSIENLYTSEESLVKIITNEFNLKSEEDDFQFIVKTFNELQEKFHKNLLLFNSWLACQSDQRIETNQKTYLSIDSKTSHFFKSIVNEKLDSIYSFDELNNLDYIENFLFPDAPKINADILAQKINEFMLLNPGEYFRGKFELRFLISFLNRLQNQIGRKKPTIFKTRKKCSLRFEFQTALSALTQYALTPDCLISFLDHQATSKEIVKDSSNTAV